MDLEIVPLALSARIQQASHTHTIRYFETKVHTEDCNCGTNSVLSITVSSCINDIKTLAPAIQ